MIPKQTLILRRVYKQTISCTNLILEICTISSVYLLKEWHICLKGDRETLVELLGKGIHIFDENKKKKKLQRGQFKLFPPCFLSPLFFPCMIVNPFRGRNSVLPVFLFFFLLFVLLSAPITGHSKWHIFWRNQHMCI